jgi:hydrogenase expression/formation protein HypC
MCVGIPGRIEEIVGGDMMRMAKVDFGGIAQDVSLAYVPEAAEGDYVIVHAGFAISQLDEQEAHETLQLLVEAGILKVIDTEEIEE